MGWRSRSRFSVTLGFAGLSTAIDRRNVEFRLQAACNLFELAQVSEA